MSTREIFENDLLIAENFNNFWKFTYRDGQSITLAEAKEIVLFRKKITQDALLKILVVIPQKIEMSKDARDYLSSPEGTRNITATAIVVKSKYSFFLSKFFIKLNPPKTPVKIFDSEPKAIQWLNKI
jgi:hypothetical protein